MNQTAAESAKIRLPQKIKVYYIFQEEKFMLHPSYAELMKVVNSDVEDGENPVVSSRYSIVLATAKRARQIIDGKKPMSMPSINKPLSIAIDELNKGLLKIELGDDTEEEEVTEETFSEETSAEEPAAEE